MCLSGRQDDSQPATNVTLDAIGRLGDVSEQITQICEDSHLEALLTDDVGNLSVPFQRVKVTGEDITGVNAAAFFPA